MFQALEKRINLASILNHHEKPSKEKRIDQVVVLGDVAACVGKGIATQNMP